MKFYAQLALGLLMWIATLFAYGGVQPEFYQAYPFICLIFAILAVALSRPTSPTMMSSLSCWLWIPILLPAFVQLIPCTAPLLSHVAPFTHAKTFGLLSSLGIQTHHGYPASLYPYETRNALFISLANVFAYFGFLFLFQDANMRRQFLRTMVVASIFILSMSAVETLSKSPMVWNWLPRHGPHFFGPFLNRNHAALLVCMAFGATLMHIENILVLKRKPIFWLCLAVAAVVCVFTTASRTGLLLIMLCIAAMAIWKRRDIYIVGAVGILVLLGLSGSQITQRLFLDASGGHSVGLRADFWKFSIQNFLNQIWLGTGVGTFTQISKHFALTGIWLHPEHAENDFLELLSETGLLGLLCMVFFLVVVFHACKPLIANKFASTDSKAMAALLIVLLLGSCFVFALPLPIFQLSAAIALAAISTKRVETKMVINHKIYTSMVVCVIALIINTYAFAYIPHPQSSNEMDGDYRLSSANFQAKHLLQAEKLEHFEKKVADSPTYAPSLYKLAASYAANGLKDKSLDAFAAAKYLDPLNIASQLAVLRHIATGLDAKTASSAIQKFLSSGLPLSNLVTDQLKLQIAVLNSDLRTYAKSNHTWRAYLIRGLLEDEGDKDIETSWTEFKASPLGNQNQIWDQFFAEIVTRSNIQSVSILTKKLQPLLGLRPDLCTTLTVLQKSFKESFRLSLLSSSRDLEIYNSAPEHRIEKIGMKFRLKDVFSTSVLDMVWVPLQQVVSPACTINITMKAKMSPYERTFVLIQDKWKMLPLKEIKSKNGTWNYELLSRQAEQIQGIGFSPLESRDWFEIKSIELVVNQTR